MKFALGLLVVLSVSIIRMPTAEATSVVWSAPSPTVSFTISADPLFRAWLYNPMVNVQYSTAVALVDAQGNTIRSIACGASVPTGSRVKFSFAPHVSADISWFGTGSAQGSPHGDWVATEPSGGQRCAPKNLYAQGTTASPSVNLFGTLAVAPPKESITVSAGDCQTQGSNKLCTFTQAGTVTANFSFAQTTGQFWGGMRDSQHPAASPSCSYGAGGLSVGPMQKETKNCVTTTIVPCANKACGGSAPVTSKASVNPPSKTTCTNSYQPYTVSVPARSIGCNVSVVHAPGTAPTIPNLTTDPNGNNTGSGAGSGSGSGSGAGLGVGVNSGQACVVGTPYTISMIATDNAGNSIRYGIDWNNDGIVDKLVPAQGYVPSGTRQTATRKFSTAGPKTVRVYAENTAGLVSGWASITFNCSAKPNGEAVLLGDADADGAGLGGAGSAASIIPDLSIRAIPSLVHSGSKSKVSWSATHVKSCMVSGSNGDSWNTLTSSVGGNFTQPITLRTTYTLTCLDAAGTAFTGSAVVNILPAFQER